MIVVFGPNGTLGRAVVQEGLRVGVEARITDVRTHIFSDVKRVLSSVPRGTVVINCAGDIRRDPVDEDRMFASNVIGPQVVQACAELFGLKVIHVSTDCVFHGMDCEVHTVEGPQTPDDFYGWTKCLGEIFTGEVVNVRTSFIAPDQGVWKMVRDWQYGCLNGWSNVYWSGSTVTNVAYHLVQLAYQMELVPIEELEGVAAVASGYVAHLATSEPISKYDVIRALAPHIPVIKEPFPAYSRALEPTIVMAPLTVVLAAEGIRATD